MGTEERLENESKNLDFKLILNQKLLFDRDETLIQNNEKNTISDLKFKKCLSLLKNCKKKLLIVFSH